ncbi:MAG: hypothetical protein V3T30_08670 [Thermodesulfobacteriota bacterium]
MLKDGGNNIGEASTSSKLLQLAYPALFCVFALEFVLFRRFVLAEISPFYPAFYDQSVLLGRSYEIYEMAQSRGFIGVILSELFTPNYQGNLLPIIANFFFLISGPSRFAALSVNLFSFLLLQLSFFYVLRKLSGSFSLSFISLGLLLSLAYPFYFAGSLQDFRIDFFAFCFYGIFISAVVASNMFLSRRFSIASAAVAVVLLLTRYITLGYLVPTYLLFLVFLFIRYFLISLGVKKEEAAARIKNLLFSAVTALAIVAPFFWLSRKMIQAYYVVGHVTGSEKIYRALNAMVVDLATNLSFYPKSVLSHLGPYAIYPMLALLIFSIIIFTTGAKNRSGLRIANLPSKASFLFLFFTILVPLLVLTLDLSKSYVVGSIVLPSVVWLVMLVLFFANCGANRVTIYFAVFVIAIGLYYQVSSFALHSYARNLKGGANVTEMYIDMGEYAEKNGITKPKISIDRVTDYLWMRRSLTVVYFEMRGRYIDQEFLLGRTPTEFSRGRAISNIKNSDFVIFSKSPSKKNSNYPFEKSVEKVRPELLKLLAREFRLLKEYQIDGKTFGVYVKP